MKQNLNMYRWLCLGGATLLICLWSHAGWTELQNGAAGADGSEPAPVVDAQPPDPNLPPTPPPQEEPQVQQPQEVVQQQPGGAAPAMNPNMPAPGGLRPPTAMPRPRTMPSPLNRPRFNPLQPKQPNQAKADLKAKPEDAAKENEPKDESKLFDFDNAELGTVIEAIAKMTGKNFDVDPNIGQMRVTVITHEKIPPEMAYQVLESILGSRGFEMKEALDGHLIKVVPSGKLGDKTDLVIGEQKKVDYDKISTHIIRLKHADPTEMTAYVQKMGSETCKVDAYGPAGMLIITDTGDAMKRIVTFLDEVDVPGIESSMEIFTLEYTRAEVLSQQIQEVLLDNAKPAGGTAQRPQAVQQQPQQQLRPPTVRPGQRTNVPGQQSPVITGSREETLRIVPDERLNSLIVIATPAMMERVRDLVKKLDTPTPYEANNLNVYELLNADSEQVEKALNQLVGTSPRSSAKGGAPGGGGGGGGGAADEIQPFEKKVMITRYEQSNALLILASPQDFKLIREIIAQLDVPQRQVHVEAVIMDVKIADNYSLVVDQAAITGHDGFVVGNTSTIKGIGVSDVTTLATSLATGKGVAEANRAISALSQGSSGGITAGWYDSLKVGTINGKKVSIPFVPLLIKAVETLTHVDILSQPSLTTQNNQEASILVGSEVPVPTMRSGYSGYPTTTTGTSTTTKPTTTTTSAYNNSSYSSYGSGISRQDVGVHLSVKPRINEGDYVNMETNIKVSQQAAVDSTSINPSDLGPTFVKSEVKNNVVVKDSCTGVIAGLISESTDRKKTHIPILGDLPGIGWMFGTKSSNREKRNLVVLLTPHIIKEGADLERVTAYKMEELRNANVDVFFEKKFIKKVKKRWFLRNQLRPSAVKSDSIGQEIGFSNGDLKRTESEHSEGNPVIQTSPSGPQESTPAPAPVSKSGESM